MNDTFRVLGLITDALTAAGAVYRIGGSVASSALGMPRSTLDIDIVADLKPIHITPLASLLGSDFYFDQEHALESIQRGSSFNLLHFETGIKIDLFLPQATPFERSAFSRETQVYIQYLEPPRNVSFSTAEDFCTSSAGSTSAGAPPSASGATSWACCGCRPIWTRRICGTGRRS